jgi:hypothetical protein
MKAAGLIGIVLAAAAALYIYNAQLVRGAGPGMGTPQEQIDVTAIRTALLEIAYAERNYAAGHGTYGTLEQLRVEGAPALGTERRGYAFQLELNGSHSFTVTATPADSGRQGWPTLSIDQSMQIAER